MLYVTGGMNNGGPNAYSTVYYLDVSLPNPTWSSTTMVSGRWQHSAVLVGTDIYIMGGYSGNSGSAISLMVDVLDTLTNTHSSKSVDNLPRMRYAHEAVYSSTESRIYVYGGSVSNQSAVYSNVVDVLDVSTGSWIPGVIPDGGTGTMYVNASIINEKIYFKSGWNGAHPNLMDVLTLDTFNGGGGGNSGTGTENFVAKFNASGEHENSMIYQDVDDEFVVGTSVATNAQQALDVMGAINVGDTDTDTGTEGAIKYSALAQDLEGFVNGEWKSLTLGAGSSPAPTITPWSENASGDVYRDANNVGIGTDTPFSRLSFGDSPAVFDNPETRIAIFEDQFGREFYGIGATSIDPLDPGLAFFGGTGASIPWDGTTGKQASMILHKSGKIRFKKNANFEEKIGIGNEYPFSRISYGGTSAFDSPDTRIALFEDRFGKEFYGMGATSGTGAEPGLAFWGGTGSSIPWNGTTGKKADFVLYKSGTVKFRKNANFEAKIGLNTDSPNSIFSLGSSHAFNDPNSRIALYELSSGTYFYGIGGATLPKLSGGTNSGLAFWGGTGSSIPYNGFSGDFPDLFINEPNGNVGIGLLSSPNEKLQVNGGISLGDTTGSNAGTIRYNGDFEGYDGSEWESLTNSVAVSSPWMLVETLANNPSVHTSYNGGRVGIGTGEDAPNGTLEVRDDHATLMITSMSDTVSHPSIAMSAMAPNGFRKGGQCTFTVVHRPMRLL
ncbi:MAG: hypothetical protein KC646_12960 [Candidatus Cloacimonetes bacterium]|nr:hypothetical protein [Candidatus Cloacimonadota bacterium]